MTTIDERTTALNVLFSGIQRALRHQIDLGAVLDSCALLHRDLTDTNGNEARRQSLYLDRLADGARVSDLLNYYSEPLEREFTYQEMATVLLDRLTKALNNAAVSYRHVASELEQMARPLRHTGDELIDEIATECQTALGVLWYQRQRYNEQIEVLLPVLYDVAHNRKYDYDNPPF